MKIDKPRIRNYLLDIKSRTLEIQALLEKYRDQDILAQPWITRGLKYLLIEIAEIMANMMTHIHAKDKGEAVSGYVETIIKSGEAGIISESLQ